MSELMEDIPAELLRALVATVGDLSVAVTQTNAQHAQTTQNMVAVADFLARSHEAGGVQNFMENRRVLTARGM